MRITKSNLLEMLAPVSGEAQIVLRNERGEEQEAFDIKYVSCNTVAKIHFRSHSESAESKISDLETDNVNLNRQLESVKFQLSQAEEKLAKIPEII
jgi:hypothetical protein